MAAPNIPLTSRFGGLAGTLAIAVLLTLGGCSGGDEEPNGAVVTPPEGGSAPPPSSSPPPPAGPGDGSGSATLSWNPPTERTDGTVLGALDGYRIVYGPYSRNYRYEIELDNPGLSRYFIDGLGAGTWYFAVIAIDSAGMESAPSAEVSKTI